MSITYLEAIRQAQATALADNPNVFIYGQDVGAFGGAFNLLKFFWKFFWKLFGNFSGFCIFKFVCE